MNERLIEQKEAENLIRWSLKYPSFIYLFFFPSAPLYVSIKYYTVIKSIETPKCMEYLLGPRHCMHKVGLSLEELAVLEGSLILSPTIRRAIRQPATSFLHQSEPELFMGFPFLQLWKEFYNQLWSYFSKAEPFWDALETAHLCMFCFTCWATNTIFTLMKAVLLRIFLGKKILFADQYLCIMDNSII